MAEARSMRKNSTSTAPTGVMLSSVSNLFTMASSALRGSAKCGVPAIMAISPECETLKLGAPSAAASAGLPRGPYFPSSVGSSVSVAQEWITPRGCANAYKRGNSSSLG